MTNTKSTPKTIEPTYIVEELPNRQRGRTRSDKWVTVLEGLQAAPGALDNDEGWARIAEGMTGAQASSLRSAFKNERVIIPEGEYEFVVRTVDGDARVYARFIG